MREPPASKRSDASPWYRQFWPWFLIALPGSVVIASFLTLAIAVRHSDEVVRDDYYKEGLAINQQLDRERLADSMNLTAALSWQPGSGEIRVVLPARVTDQSLQLHWLHPLKRQLDRDIVLQRHREAESTATNSLYGGKIDTPLGGRFYVQLENMTADASKAWRLRGEVSASSIDTTPASTTLSP
jgi:hypothetical protein